MPLDAEGARRFYDRIGRGQDSQRFYEDPATHRLAGPARLAGADRVYELGCGTGRYADWLLGAVLRPEAVYLGVEISPVMARLAGERLARFAPRAEVVLIDPPGRTLPGEPGSFDRFVANYVFDLLGTGDAQALLAEAHRLLAPDGLLCAVSLTPGPTPISGLVSAAWGAIATRRPALVGGCRPIELTALLDPSRWIVTHDEVVTSWGVPSEVLVARRLEPAGAADGP